MRSRTLFVSKEQTNIQRKSCGMEMCPVMAVCMNMVLFSMHYDT